MLLDKFWLEFQYGQIFKILQYKLVDQPLLVTSKPLFFLNWFQRNNNFLRKKKQICCSLENCGSSIICPRANSKSIVLWKYESLDLKSLMKCISYKTEGQIFSTNLFSCVTFFDLGVLTKYIVYRIQAYSHVDSIS